MGIVRRLVIVFYLCGSDSDKEDRFDPSKISNYVVNMLKNWSCKYSNNYFIKFVDFILIYYAINLNIISSCIVSWMYRSIASLNQ